MKGMSVLLSINLSQTFKLETHLPSPHLSQLKSERSSYHSNWSLSLNDFLTQLPVFLTDRFLSNLSNDHHKINRHFHANSAIAFINHCDYEKSDLFEHLTYNHYDALERDIKKIDPSYKLAKKNNKTLSNYIDYYKPVVETIETNKLLSHISLLTETIASDSFVETFLPINDKERYILPYKNLDKQADLKQKLKETGFQYPLYLLSNGKQEVVFFYQDHTYFYTTFDSVISSGSFQNSDDFTHFLNSYFESQTGSERTQPITAFPLETHKHQLELHAPVYQNTPYLSLVDRGFPIYRKLFNSLYNVKGRSKEIVWENAVSKMKENMPALEKPYLNQMGEALNKDLIKDEALGPLYSPDDTNHFFDFMFKLNLLSSEHFSSSFTNNEMAYEDIFKKSFSLSSIPDFEMEAKNSPSFQDILSS